MTQEELIQREEDLDIEVTPEVEDAFYFLRVLEKSGEIGNDFDNEKETAEEYEERLDREFKPAQNAGERLARVPKPERIRAIHYAYRMLDNIKKYGIACHEWAED